MYYRYSLAEQGFASPGADFAALSFLPSRMGYLYREKDGWEWAFDADGHMLRHATTLNIKGESCRLKEKRRAGLLGRASVMTPARPTETE